MMMTGVKSLFVDTNILIYSSNTDSPLHTQATIALKQTKQQGIVRTISTQSLREYFAGATRPRPDGTLPPVGEVLSDIDTFRASYRVINDTHAISTRVFALAKSIVVRGRQIHDTNIVATMLTYRITHLLTHNVADFNRFASLITIIPLDSL